MVATFEDLQLECWLRFRNSGKLEWITRDGKHIPIKDLEDGHLANIISMLSSQKEAAERAEAEDAEWEDEQYEALSSIGDEDFL